jgi:hypothetical protein
MPYVVLHVTTGTETTAEPLLDWASTPPRAAAPARITTSPPPASIRRRLGRRGGVGLIEAGSGAPGGSSAAGVVATPGVARTSTGLGS